MKGTLHFICQDRNIESEKISSLQRHDLKRPYPAKIPPGKKQDATHEPECSHVC
jgi:hypothetical protein